MKQLTASWIEQRAELATRFLANLNPGQFPKAENVCPPVFAKDNEILIYNPIGFDPWGEGMSAKEFRDELADKGDVVVRINSPGGDVFDGFAIMEALRDHQAEHSVEVKVDGVAASAASYIAAIGDPVEMAPSSRVMVHGARAGVWGPAPAMREMASLLDSIDRDIANVYAERSKKSREEWLAMMNPEDTWLNAEQAVETGFADRIKEVPKREKKTEDVDQTAVVAWRTAQARLDLTR